MKNVLSEGKAQTRNTIVCEKIDSTNRGFIDEFIRRQWYTTTMVIRGKEIDMTKTEGFYVREEGSIIGLVTYLTYDNIMEIISLDSLKENQGVGSDLIKTVIEEARERKCSKIVLVTTNDNINAMRFYQKRGFDMARLFRNAMDVSRKLKPEIPLLGENAIPLRHEIEFEMSL